jgi:DNA-directed RNA polymerase specialized sigma subunit
VKQARVVSWSDVGGREAALVQRCAVGEESACAELVAEHQRMVVQLAMNLLGDRDEVSLDQHIAAHGDFRGSGDTTPDRVLAQKELAAQLKQALDHLPFDQRTAIVLREIDGLSYEEIAFSLGVAVGTVKSRLTRARQALRLELREARTA